jgi:hypothetical protein
MLDCVTEAFARRKDGEILTFHSLVECTHIVLRRLWGLFSSFRFVQARALSLTRNG